ncbi:MAG: hypothetical protein P4M05_27995 [Bradyrhizobium sp.]|nr:hypothetical protein [Bradyrhizobium sp.]
MARSRTALVMTPEKFGLTKAEAAAYIGVTSASFEAMVVNGDMPQARRFGSVERWIRHELERAAMDMPAAAPKIANPYDRVGRLG